MQSNGLLPSWGNQVGLVEICSTIWTQVLMGHPQLYSSLSLTFSPEWLQRVARPLLLKHLSHGRVALGELLYRYIPCLLVGKTQVVLRTY